MRDDDRPKGTPDKPSPSEPVRRIATALPQRPAPETARRDIWNISISMVISVAMLGVAFVFWSQAARFSQSEKEIRRRAATCNAPGSPPTANSREESGDPVDPTRVVQSFPKGARLPLSQELRILDGAGMTRFARLGDARVLPPRQVTMVNLWASWCKPCKDELPRFKALFETHPEWGDSVRFLPILTDDQHGPEIMLAEYRDKMPAFELFGADYTGFTDVLAKDALYRNSLPVTMLVGCGQRLRWIRFGEIPATDMQALATEISKLVDELRNCSTVRNIPRTFPTSPRPASCGDGRCGEGEDAQSCSSDCYCGNFTCDGTETESTCPGDCIATCGNGHPDPRENCSNCERDIKCPLGSKCSMGQCVDTKKCGNGKRDSGETCASCPKDVKCAPPLRCVQGNCIDPAMGF